MSAIDPTCFGARLRGTEMKLTRRSSTPVQVPVTIVSLAINSPKSPVAERSRAGSTASITSRPRTDSTASMTARSRAGSRSSVTSMPPARLTDEQRERSVQSNLNRALQRDIAQGQSLAALATQPSLSIPRVNFLKAHPAELEKAILDRVHDNDRRDFVSVLSAVPLGILPIVGFAGSGKTDLMATTVLLAIGKGPVVVCAPTHTAASNIAERVSKLADLAYAKAGKPLPVIIRGFPWQADERQVRSRAQGKGEPPATNDHSEMSLSLSEWVLKMFGLFGYKLDQQCKLTLLKLTQAAQKDTNIRNLRNVISRREGYTEEHAQTLKDLAQSILTIADVVCCTTHASTSDILSHWTQNIAKSTFLDEAGAMSMPEALVPWYHGRPLVLAGDVRQLPPCVMTSTQKNPSGGPLNFFEAHLEVSVLERLMRMQWPCWSSRRQHRMVVNQEQAQIALALLESLIKVHLTKLLVVSPYSATKAFLEGLIQTRMATLKPGPLHAGLSNVEVGTADGFPGKEEAITIFLTTVTQESGPGFVKDPRRFNVGVTRHSDFVFVVGEIAAMDQVKDAKVGVTLSDQGEHIVASGKKMRDAYQWFRTKGRVARVDFWTGETAWFR
ncbi:P-loop containing nucleoside triphosphate hydrolase protein [Dactylonectria macrodidyma]|uniref:P-loop containing nucleoside triphosphate hydrolase protein n=1 Tax=Dactylonectria macrodidyma TaxID=307937 RepID=A0A9P9E062_9HYPO|nr:P-loop containing nucleoside triphosphate hydrolase protein [Dactylonectria macrodidyma]